jgi:hypothetical protein
MTARANTPLRLNHWQLAQVRLRLVDAILRNGNGVVTMKEAIERAKRDALRLVGPVNDATP